MFMLLPYFAHIVPTGLKNGCSTMIYKHSVPTGLRTLIDWIYFLKLTMMVTKYLRNLYVNTTLTDFPIHAKLVSINPTTGGFNDK